MSPQAAAILVAQAAVPAQPTQPIEIKAPSQRLKLWHNVAIRLADEGVPVRAIVRAILLSYDEVREVLEAACERGTILNIPRDDWPVGTRRDERQPDTVPLELEDDHIVMLAIHEFKFTPNMGKIFVALLRRPEMTKNALHVVTQRDDDNGRDPTQIKILDVYVCKMRKLLPDNIKITTVWGRGYYISPACKEAAFKLLGIKQDTFVVPAERQPLNDGEWTAKQGVCRG